MCEAIVCEGFVGERFVGATPRLRRYAHALLAAWPRDDGGASPRADQDADDLAQKALLDVRREGSAPGPACDAVLFRRATDLARRHFAGKAGEIHVGGGQIREEAASGEWPGQVSSGQVSSGDFSSGHFASGHFAWAPEARALPRLPLDLRAILALVALERLSYAEAGRMLDIPEERALARLAVARARLASEISGVGRPHLVALAPGGRNEAESDLHRYADDLLDATRGAEIAAFLETSPQAARRVAEWRRQSERLRGAFAPLMALPLPPSLDFAAPQAFSQPRRRTAPGRGVFRRLGALFAAPSQRAAPQLP
jgi:DNA-directed RNA polymerase specialized sigma24 family protein